MNRILPLIALLAVCTIGSQALGAIGRIAPAVQARNAQIQQVLAP